MSTPKADLQEISLRIKYESFAKLTAELSTAHSFQDVATVLQINLKYIFNFSSFRILVFYESEKLQFEITRQHTAVKYEDVTILPITAEVIKSNIAVVFDEQELTEKKDNIYPLFHPPLIKHLCLYPLRANEHQCLIIGAGNKNNQPPVDADFRFLKLVGEYLLSKLTQLILTERLERMVKKRTEQLNLANQELSTLFYRASHDFNAPMTTLLGLARLCRMQVNQPEEVLALLQHTTVVISQAQTMFKKFKVISEAEIQETSIDRIAIHPFLQKHIDQFNFKSKEKGIKLDYTATGEQHILFSIDILSALLENLTENAIQFHRFTDDSFIHIAAHSTPSLLTLRVMDNGMGIAKDQQSTIFNLYTRANENSKGNGLGLYLVKRIVEKLKGTVRVESELNKGSQFEITIPLGTDSKANLTEVEK